MNIFVMILIIEYFMYTFFIVLFTAIKGVDSFFSKKSNMKNYAFRLGDHH